MADKGKPIVITLTIYPLGKNKQRRVAISGASEGDMPVMHATTFAGLHPAINQMWGELLSRGTQPVTLEPAETEDAQPETQAQENDQLVAAEETVIAPAQADAPSAPLLSSIDATETSEESDG